MRTFLLIALVCLPWSARAQQPVREALQRQIFERLVENYRTQAGLTDEQYVQFRSVFERQFRERRQSEVAYRELLRAVEAQLRPGVAADADSLAVLLESLAAQQVEHTRTEAAYLAEYETFLSTVQRAQLLLTMERFQRQIDNLIRRRAAGNQRQN